MVLATAWGEWVWVSAIAVSTVATAAYLQRLIEQPSKMDQNEVLQADESPFKAVQTKSPFELAGKPTKLPLPKARTLSEIAEFIEERLRQLKEETMRRRRALEEAEEYERRVQAAYDALTDPPDTLHGVPQ